MSARGVLVAVVCIALLTMGPWLYYRAEGSPPQLEAPEAIVLGSGGGRVTLGFADPGGALKDVRVALIHAGGELTLAEQSLPGSLLRGGETAELPLEVELDAEQIAALQGDALLELSATDWSLFANRSSQRVPIEIDLVPPSVEVQSGLTYVRHGGSGAVAYRVSSDTTRHGVEVGKVFFEGHPRPGGGSGEQVALFAIPADAARDPEIRVVAEDPVGNRAQASWAVVPQYRAQPSDRIELSTRFIEKVLPRFGKPVPDDPSALASAFDRVNTQIRAANEQTIREALRPSDAELKLAARLDQMKNSKVTSRFGEKRSYYLDGTSISRATHYGYDLASTTRARIAAAGSGRVAFAGDLGIYGKCVLIDHGMGLATLYGHLSQLDVSEGASVAQGQALGRSGETGLAGGDHLHFAVLVGGVYVDPIEWWDPKWVKSHIHVAL